MEKPVPQETVLSSPYWQAAKEEKYVLQKCNRCGGYNSYPRKWCMHCWSTELEWTPVSGNGEVVTYSIVHQPPNPAWETPYVLAVVRLAEGIQVMSNILLCDVNKVEIGMKVKVTFEQRGEMKIPQFVSVS